MAGNVGVVRDHANLEVVLKRPGGQVRRAYEGTATVNHEQLGVEDGALIAPLRWPPPTIDPRDVRERAVWTGVGAGAVRGRLEHDIDLAAAIDGGLKVGCNLGKRVRGVADEQDPFDGR